ncbi:hypothetical protein SKAU_G00278140 [Synaphobranchus kaupii]|uniref:Uncharacterized protein n=1 Tax=Synaphobranchus kaupii TaxID=118154 RepID=A0A9Q1EWH9_SYNKA|nr:hypothetical protein SKAU_G00278140 [Synaphobranchus kaupii]
MGPRCSWRGPISAPQDHSPPSLLKTGTLCPHASQPKCAERYTPDLHPRTGGSESANQHQFQPRDVEGGMDAYEVGPVWKATLVAPPNKRESDDDACRPPPSVWPKRKEEKRVHASRPLDTYERRSRWKDGPPTVKHDPTGKPKTSTGVEQTGNGAAPNLDRDRNATPSVQPPQ